VTNFAAIGQAVAEISLIRGIPAFKMAAVRHLGFIKFDFETGSCYEGRFASSAKFRGNYGQTVAEMAVFLFLEMAAVVLDLVDAYLYHAETAFRSVYHCTKPDWRRCNSFDNVKVSIIIAFWLKKAYSRP